MKPRFIGIFFVSLLTACTSMQSPKSNGVQWTKHDIVGLTMTLVDPHLVEWMHFNGSGVASVSFGRDGNVVGAAYNWALVDGRLRLFDSNDKPYEELTLLSRDASNLIARRLSGRIVKYRIVSLKFTLEQRSQFARSLKRK